MTNTDNTDTARIEDGDRRWWAMLNEWAAHQWQQLNRHLGARRAAQWPPPWAPHVIVIAAITVVLVIVVPLLSGVVFLIWAALRQGAGLVGSTAAVRTVLTPVHAYLYRHAEGLALNGATLWWTWCAAGVVLFVLSTGRVFGARIGWLLYGGATVTMVWGATTEPGRPVAAGITALWWVMASLFALRRGGHPQVIAHLPQLPMLDWLLRRHS